MKGATENPAGAPRLVVLAGLPGTGKSTLARTAARALGATHLRIDTIEQALRGCGQWAAGAGIGAGADIGPAGYLVAYRVAEDNLRLGGTVVADSVNPLRVTREAWRSVARRTGAAIVEIEILCSDSAEHRRRVETRRLDIEGPGIEGFVLPAWQDVVNREYEGWDNSPLGPPLRIDTAFRTIDDCAAEMLDRIGRTQHELGANSGPA